MIMAMSSSVSLCFSFRSIALAADDSLVAWGPSPTYGELVGKKHL